MPALAESTPEDDRIADTSNVASLYKVSARSHQMFPLQWPFVYSIVLHIQT